MELIDTISSALTPRVLSLVGTGFVILVTLKIISAALGSNSSNPGINARGSQSGALKVEPNSIENRNGSQLNGTVGGDTTMEISQLWVYPIKALRGYRIPTATLTKEGFTYDRKFILLRDLEKTPREFKNITVNNYPSVCLFHTSIQGSILTVSYRPPGTTEAEAKDIEIPLEPTNLQKLERVEVNMHFSPSLAFDMGQPYNEWFSEIFGFKVILAYWGGNPRHVLGNLPGVPTNVSSKPRSPISSLIAQLPIIGPILQSGYGVIAFSDVAPFLIITEESSAQVSTRLPDDVEVDITKFRANIILKNSSSAFEEDFWGELIFGTDKKIILTSNCARCTSLNIDYHTGKLGAGKDGAVLKLLSQDRRVDQGTKYSPVFGRYGFVGVKSEGKALRVGDQVVVGKRNEERTRFYWPGLST